MQNFLTEEAIKIAEKMFWMELTLNWIEWWECKWFEEFVEDDFEKTFFEMEFVWCKSPEDWEIYRFSLLNIYEENKELFLIIK